MQESKRSAHSNANKIISPEVCLLIDSVLREGGGLNCSLVNSIPADSRSCLKENPSFNICRSYEFGKRGDSRRPMFIFRFLISRNAKQRLL